MKSIVRWIPRVQWVVASLLILLPAAMAQEPKAGADTSKTNSAAVTDYEDFEQVPIRNTELLRMMEEADLIAVVGFDPKKLMTDAPGTNRWVASVSGGSEGFRQGKFKGSCGKQIEIEGDLKAFENPADPYISRGGFAPRNQWLVLLKAVDTNGLYKCIEANPGGFRQYGGRGDSDHRTLIAGRVNGGLVVEGGLGYRSNRMSGPTNLRDALEGLMSGVNLTASSKGGAAVELRFENPGRRPVSIPKNIALIAPMLWAEIEEPDSETALLAPDDYRITRLPDPYKEMQNIAPSNAVTVSVEIPTGPAPKDANLHWAHNNHVKRLAGSLPEGERTVRVLFRPTKDSLVLSNPVKVTGKAGGAGPAQLAALEKPPSFVAAPDSAPEKGLPPLQDDVRGEIWFDTNRDGNWEIYVMDANGSNAVNVTKTADRGEFGPVPSPDGKRVAYHAGNPKVGDGGMWGRWNMDGKEIWVMDRDGQNAKKLADNAITPAWWPDGKAVLYGSKKDGLCLHYLETGVVTQLLKSVSSWLNLGTVPLSFAPATRQLVCGGGLNSTLNGMMLAVELDDKAEFKDFKALTTIYRGCTQRWASPDGRRVIYAHHDPKYSGAIILWTINPDGTGARRFDIGRPGYRWDGYGTYCESPDGKMFAAGCWGEIYVNRYADGAQLQLTKKQGANMAPQWHRGPQGK